MVAASPMSWWLCWNVAWALTLAGLEFFLMPT